MTIKRYMHDKLHCRMSEDPGEGDWVLYEDHRLAVHLMIELMAELGPQLEIACASYEKWQHRATYDQVKIIYDRLVGEASRPQTTRWFGTRHTAPAYETRYQTATPVGAECCHCDEPIAKGDDGWIYANGPVAHRECYLRQIVGSVAHQQRLCSCFGGVGCDEEGLTKRQAAKAALDYWELHGVA